MIGDDNIVRFIDVYVETLDLGEVGFMIPVGATWAPPYRPKLKLKIYIYGYLERIRSNRRLEIECKSNKELIWLTGIWRFQSDKGKTRPGYNVQTAVADAGYFTENGIIDNKDDEDFPIVVSPSVEGGSAIRSKNGKAKKVPSAEYEVGNFAYDEDKDVYICREKQILKRITKAPVKDSHGRQTYRYRCESEVCAICSKKGLCT